MTKLTAKILIIIVISCAAAFGQARLSAFSIKASTLLDDVRALKTQNPQIKNEDLVNKANELLAVKGFNFIFDFDSTVCQKIADARRSPKNAGAPVRLNARLNSVEGEFTNVVLPESQTEKSECGACSVALPVLEITAKTFVTIIQNRNIKFHTPPNFSVNEISLVEPKASSVVVRSWKIPFRAAPYAISEDGKIVFVDLPAAELKDLALAVYEDGALLFYAKTEIDSDARLVPATDAAKTANQPNFSFAAFGAGEKMKILKFAAPCQ